MYMVLRRIFKVKEGFQPERLARVCRHLHSTSYTNDQSPAAATWQLPIGQPPVTWQPRQHRSTPVTVGQRRSTPPTTGQRWRSTTVAGGEPPLTAAGPPMTTIGPPVNGGWWAGQRAGLDRSGSGLGRVRVGSGPCPDRSGSDPPRGMPRPAPTQYLGYKSLAASHVAASYWTAASDVAATSAPGLEIGLIRRIQGIRYGVLEFLRVGTTLDIFKNIILLYFQYGVLVFTGYGVLSLFPLWSLVSAGTDTSYLP
nr:hypothetical protein [Tanacetum cinerariifolium]